MIQDKSFIPEIWTQELTKIYDRGVNSVKAVDRIDITMESGVHGFLGPNGAGKTSTINMLIGAISITEGKAKIKGLYAGSVNARKIIGFLPQNPSFYDTMTGEQYLKFVGELSGLKRRGTQEKALELMGNLK